MPHGLKAGNEYAAEFHAARVYDQIPKAVFAAVAFAFAERISGQGFGVAGVIAEWRILHQNGIVPQAPPKLPTGGSDV